MREIVLDTETTGLEPAEGHRVVEIGAVELLNHVPTGRSYHQYVNPMRAMPKEAFEVHGLSDEFLRDKPPFARIAAAFRDFIGEATALVIHNASFDLKFLNAEFTLVGMAVIEASRAIDTVSIARKKYPGSPASLDALCRRFGVDSSRREKHGALLDAEILAEVYLELIGGRQPDFGLSGDAGSGADVQAAEWRSRPRPVPLPPRITEAEQAAHQAFIQRLGDTAVWRRFN